MIKPTRWVEVSVSVLLVLPLLPASAAAPQEVDQSINRARDYLYSKQHDGNWEIAPEFHPAPGNPGSNGCADANWGGLTALAVHALLAAGESPTGDRLRPAIELLIKSPMRGCPYALCQRDQVLQMLPRTRDVKHVAYQDGLYLQQFRTGGEALGMYWYAGGNRDDYDHSVSQFGVLGIWACAETGFEVPANYWSLVERAWQHHQDASGGWSYKFHGGGTQGWITPSMTAAGIATLYVTQDYVHSMEGVNCIGNITNPSIEHGMKWLSDNFGAVFGPVQNSEIQTYTLYGIERIGVAGGYKYFGEHDWYGEGSDWLVHHQNGDGSWAHNGPDCFWDQNHNNVPATAFAMFFLTRGREPVAINKAQYDTIQAGKRAEARWNQRPRDVAKITHYIEKNTERNLNWQIVNLARTSADELQDAPILYLSGDRPLDLAPEDIAKLRQFVEDGGLILGNPDGISQHFIDSFKALGAKLFPIFEFRPLPEDHPIYTREQFRGDDVRHRTPMLGLTNGVRELMIIPSLDFAKAWQTDSFSKVDAFNITDNLYLYAAGKTSFRRGDTTIVHPAGDAPQTVPLARLDYGGNADPEPGAWRRLAAIVHNDDKIDLRLQTIKLGEGKLTGFKIAHLTGTARFQFNAAQRTELQHFVQNGGVLLIDAAGNSAPFIPCVEAELQAMFPQEASQLDRPIPAEDDLYQGGPRIPWGFRIYAIKTAGLRGGTPQLRGLKINGRWAVLWSREDITNGLLGRDTDGVTGYTPQCAVNLVRQIILKLGK
jgi:hypothetical protein